MGPSDTSMGLPVISPSNMVPVQVIAREQASPDSVTFFITLPGTEQAPAPYLPGQFVTLALPTPQETLYRSYSLCSDGNSSAPWEITIKKQHKGAVSTYFYHHVDEGTLLYSSLPRGTFTLPRRMTTDTPLIFIAAGSGITPIYGMLRALDHMGDYQQPQVQLHYASKTPREMIYHGELMAIDPYESWLRQFHYFSADGDRMTVENILETAGIAARKAHWYVCGPELLKQELHQRLSKMRVPDTQIHAEVFAVREAPAYRAPGMSTGGHIHVKDTNMDLEFDPQETLLAALERQGYRPDFNCRIGLCGTCKLQILEGSANPVGEVMSPDERKQGFVLSCIAVPDGNITIASGGKPPAGIVRVPGAASGSPRFVSLALTRVGALLSVGIFLMGAWRLTNHTPPSLYKQSSSQTSGSNNSAPGSGSGDTPTATSNGGTGGTGGGTTPTPTTTSGGSKSPTATPPPGSTATPTPPPGQPTATPQPGQPTATPKPAPTATPKPVATSTPTK